MKSNGTSDIMNSYTNEIYILKTKLIDFLKTSNSSINSIIYEAFMSQGKFLRPRLFLSSCEIFEYTGPVLFELAAVCEFIHCASLLHDDVIDDSKFRRNKPTINFICDNKTAVLLGDLIYSTACRLMVKSKSLDVIDSFAECIRTMSESELFQLNLLWNPKTTLDDYFSVIKGKTSNLFSASLSAPAVLTNSSLEIVKLMQSYGTYLGYIFQIIDDCLDFSKEKFEIGKETCHDIKEGKLTLPLLLALKSSSNGSDVLIKTMNQLFETKCPRPEEVVLIVQFIKNNGFIDQSKAIAFEYAKKCEEIVNNLSTLIANKNKLDLFYKIPFEIIERQN